MILSSRQALPMACHVELVNGSKVGDPDTYEALLVSKMPFNPCLDKCPAVGCRFGDE